jgi:hypothetical protein
VDGPTRRTEAVSKSIEEGRGREQGLSDQLGCDFDSWEEWQSADDLKKEEELFNILDDPDRNYQECIGEMELGGEWSFKPLVQEKEEKKSWTP